jgi:hypothetical protein
VTGVLDFSGDDAVHGVAIVAGVDVCRHAEGMAKFDCFGDGGPGNGLARGRGDE